MYEPNLQLLSFDNASKLNICKVADFESKKAVCDLRFLGYKGLFPSPLATWDHWDELEYSTILLATMPDGQAVGTIRILESLTGPLEVDSYCHQYRRELPENCTFIEGARLVAINKGIFTKLTVQASLWKAAYRYALTKEIDYLIAWAKKGPDKAYTYLCFCKPDNSDFKHEKLGNITHSVFYLDLVNAENQLKSSNHPMWSFFHCNQHENLIWY